MNTKCGPSYANIFLSMFEERYIYPLIETMSKLYLRFIDDIFLLWAGNTDPSIKFDFNFSNKKINFLDTVVCKTGNQALQERIQSTGLFTS